jgi:6-pyruvoyltetrahydropterin/6-carboxytetrahydropterin synthase
MYEVYVAARFEAAHRLLGNFGPAARTHGHTYRLEVIVRGQHLGEDGTLYDIGELGRAVEGLAGSMHYRDLNEVPGLAEVNTTAEALASYCWDKLAEPLRGQGLDSLTVRIWESPDACAAREDALS